MKNEHKCKLCGWMWESKLEAPAACPRCKRYDWQEKEDDSNAK